MHLVHIAIGTLCAVIGYVLGIYYPLMPMTALIAAGLAYNAIIAVYRRRRAAELQAILDAQPQPQAVEPDTTEVNPDLLAAFQRMQAQ